MFLHLGQDTVVLTDDIIGIFDLDTTTISKPTRDYLANMQKTNRVINVSFELPKTFVLTYNKKTKQKMLYISQISTATLIKRIENINYINQ